MMEKTITKVLLIALAVSLLLNLILFKDNQKIVKKEDHSVHTYVQSWNGQVMINQNYIYGDAVEWKFKPMTDFKSPEELVLFKNALHPTSSYFSKQEKLTIKIWKGLSTKEVEYFTWPVIFKKTKDEIK